MESRNIRRRRGYIYYMMASTYLAQEEEATLFLEWTFSFLFVFFLLFRFVSRSSPRPSFIIIVTIIIIIIILLFVRFGRP
jgi:hypothetical protein